MSPIFHSSQFMDYSSSSHDDERGRERGRENGREDDYQTRVSENRMKEPGHTISLSQSNRVNWKPVQEEEEEKCVIEK